MEYKRKEVGAKEESKAAHSVIYSLLLKCLCRTENILEEE